MEQMNLFLIDWLSTYLVLPRASKLVIVAATVYLVAFFALASGIFNALIEGAAAGSQAFILPTRSAQTLSEAIVMIFILFIGMGGALLLFRAGQALTRKTQGAFLASGFALIGISLMLGFTLVSLKG
jgi:hypothetical protein